MPALGQSSAPARAGLVLTTLILAAGVANINLAVANVALPDIGKAFTASQTALDLVAVGYSLGLAASVLSLGAIGDRVTGANSCSSWAWRCRSRPVCSPPTRCRPLSSWRPGLSAGCPPGWPIPPLLPWSPRCGRDRPGPGPLRCGP